MLRTRSSGLRRCRCKPPCSSLTHPSRIDSKRRLHDSFEYSCVCRFISIKLLVLLDAPPIRVDGQSDSKCSYRSFSPFKLHESGERAVAVICCEAFWQSEARRSKRQTCVGSRGEQWRSYNASIVPRPIGRDGQKYLLN